MTWFLAPSLVALRNEINVRWPKRDKSSDGALGDASHAARVSSHNPLWSAPGKWSGVVRAIDVDNNGAPGVRTPLVDAVLKATIGDDRVWYVIWNRQIWSRTYGWKPRPYTGSNAHDHHVHVSLRETITAWSDTSRWLTQPRPKPITASVRVATLAGRYDRTPELLDAQIRRFAHDDDILLLTEVANPVRAAVLDYVGWTTLQDSDPKWMGECALLVRNRTWKVKHWQAFKVGEDTGPGGPVVAILAVVEHRDTGIVGVVGTAHLQSGVESVWARLTLRVRAHKASVQLIRKLVNEWMTEHDADFAIVQPDFNLNLLRAWVRKHIREAWPELRPPQPEDTPTNGDHPASAAARRLTVWPVARHLPGYMTTVLPADPASDHRGVSSRGTATKRSH